MAIPKKISRFFVSQKCKKIHRCPTESGGCFWAQFRVVLWMLMLDVKQTNLKKRPPKTKTRRKVNISSKALLTLGRMGYRTFFHPSWSFLLLFSLLSATCPLGHLLLTCKRFLLRHCQLPLALTRKDWKALNFILDSALIKVHRTTIQVIFRVCLNFSNFLNVAKSLCFIEGICSPRCPSHHLLQAKMRVSERPKNSSLS